MTTETSTGTTWAAPGPGLWERDAAHQERPFSRLWLERAIPAFKAGTAEAFARFGLPFAAFDVVDLEGWFFATLTPVDEAMFPARAEAAERALAERPWRAIADEWDRAVRDDYAQRNRAVQSVDPADLNDAALADHLADCLRLFSDAGTRHFLQAVSHWIGVGLFIAEADRLAGWTPERSIQALTGGSPNSTAPVTAVRRIASAVAANERARALLASGGQPSAVLADLASCSPAVRDALGAYLDEHGWQVFSGFDFTHQAMAELPGLLLETIRDVPGPPQAPSDSFAELRNACPAEDRARLETVIEDALLLYGLRDDDSGLTTQRPIGLVRRALLEAGSRLAARGLLRDADDIFDATADELAPLLKGSGERPSANELARRADRRRRPVEPPPRRLGEEDPPPDGPLPPAMEAIMGALFTCLELEDTADDESEAAAAIRGAAASVGVYEGPARIIRGPDDFARIEAGDVLVASITTPAYNVLLPLLGAVVTDRGGVLSHPAIVAREFRIPAVVGTRDATTRITDGARIRVDGREGLVTLLD